MSERSNQSYHTILDAIKSYYTAEDVAQIGIAYHLAEEAHKDEVRLSGRPYIVHPLNVALILAEMRLDKETIIAALLHETLRFTEDGGAKIRKTFGEEVTFLVLGVAKIGKLTYAADRLESQAENFRKMFLAMAQDIRVILIKLADRLHNMRELEFQTPERQQEVSRETLDIYAPIAQRLGISMISMELEDLALKFLEPDVYYELAKRVELTKAERQQYIDRMIGQIKMQLAESHVEAVVVGRFKHFFSIYRKMVNRGKSIDDMYDLFAIRIIVGTMKECYAVLGMIHELYTPIPGRFKDYISMPKSNMYRSLHTTVLDGTGQSFEIQIRTQEMHHTAEYGIAAHWKYKEGKGEGLILNKEEEKLNWLKQILEWQRSDNREFMSLLKNDFNLMSESIYCFTPTGEVKNLPEGANVIDFAYSIHSAIGNKMVGARVNGNAVPIDYVIQNGDRIEIVTSQNSAGPSKDWLTLVKSAQARNKINQWFREAGREENIKLGRSLLEEYCKNYAVDPKILEDPVNREVVQKKYGYHDWDSVLAAVGHGGLKESRIIARIRLEQERLGLEGSATDTTPQKPGDGTKGTDKGSSVNHIGSEKQLDPDPVQKQSPSGNVTGRKPASRIIVGRPNPQYHPINLAKCCTPLPGDEIVAFHTKGRRGVMIHRTDCINMIKLSEDERDRLMEAEWDSEGIHLSEIRISAKNRVGIIADISAVISGSGLDIASMDCKLQKQGMASLNVVFEVTDKNMLAALVERLLQIDGVMEIQRGNG